MATPDVHQRKVKEMTLIRRMSRMSVRSSVSVKSFCPQKMGEDKMLSEKVGETQRKDEGEGGRKTNQFARYAVDHDRARWLETMPQ